MPIFSITENMPQDVQTRAFPKDLRSLQPAHFIWGSVLIGVLMAAVYYRVLAKLVTDWWQIPDFSHGFLVPIFAAYLVWTKRESLLGTKISPTWYGIAVIAFGLMVLLLGEYGAELFLSRVSLVIVLAGLVLCFGGWQLLNELRFALLVLFLAIPIPAIIFNQITLPLQILASKLASALLPLFGVPVLREGNVIELPAMKSGGGRGMQRHPLSNEFVHSLSLLWLLYGKVHLAESSAGPSQRSDCNCGQCSAHSWHGVVRPVLES